MELSNSLPQVITNSSRIVQESINVGQGVSIYGTLATFIDINIAKIDQLAEYLGDVAAQKIVRSIYNKQHFDFNSKYRTFLNRNIYLNKEKRKSMAEERYRYGFLTKAAIEAALKFGSRTLGKTLNKKDCFITCEQIYAVLVDYVYKADKNANINRAKIELNKIRNSFPLDVSEKRKLALKYSHTQTITESLDVSSILNKGNESLVNSLSYFLTVLSKQLYGAEIESDKNIVNYYGLIDLNGQYGNELRKENEYNYDCVAADQTAYLQISRGLMKNMFKDSPGVDLKAISARANELAQYDPYAIRQKKLKGIIKGSLSLGTIVANNPEIALIGLSTALSQFKQSDETLQLSKDYMNKVGIGGNEFDVIREDTNSIIHKILDNDLSQVILTH